MIAIVDMLKDFSGKEIFILIFLFFMSRSLVNE